MHLTSLAGVLAVLSIISFLVLLIHTNNQVDYKRTETPVRIDHTIKKEEETMIPDKNVLKQISRRAPPQPAQNPPILYHFIHIPKCGGTSMTAILRQMACHRDPLTNVDCCTNPGFCDNNDHRSCKAIKGCVNHLPQRQWLFEAPPSITIMREPRSRLLSAWFYRGHSPNLDFFQVRPEFKQIKLGLRPKVVFEEYIEMPEYQNIQTRMLGANSFPYRNVTITEEVFQKAVEALDALFFIGLQEAYFISIKLLLRETEMDKIIEAPTIRERRQKPSLAKMKLKENTPLMQRVKDVNDFDYRLYKLGVAKFCKTIQKHPDLLDELRSTTKVEC